jgi:hypothetical protein
MKREVVPTIVYPRAAYRRLEECSTRSLKRWRLEECSTRSLKRRLGPTAWLEATFEKKNYPAFMFEKS